MILCKLVFAWIPRRRFGVPVFPQLLARVCLERISSVRQPAVTIGTTHGWLCHWPCVKHLCAHRSCCRSASSRFVVSPWCFCCCMRRCKLSNIVWRSIVLTLKMWNTYLHLSPACWIMTPKLCMSHVGETAVAGSSPGISLCILACTS